MFGNKIIEKPEKKGLKRPQRDEGDVENDESTSKKSKAIKISSLKDWKPPKQMGTRNSVLQFGGWNTFAYVQSGSVLLTLPRELYEKNTSVFGKYESVLKNSYWMQGYRHESLEKIRKEREKKLEVFKISILTGNKRDGVTRYLEALEMILSSYVFFNMGNLYLVLQYFFEIDSKPARDTFRNFGFNFNRKICQNEPISDLKDLSNLFREEYAIRDNLSFDLCAYFNILQRTNYLFPRKLQLLSKKVREIRNEFAHNLNEDFWTNEKCEKSISKIDEFCQEIFQQGLKECSKGFGTRIKDIADSVPSSPIKLCRYQSLLSHSSLIQACMSPRMIQASMSPRFLSTFTQIFTK